MKQISTIAGEFEDLVMLQQYCNSQYDIIKTLTEDNVKMKGEIEHLKSLLASASPLMTPTQAQATPKLAVSKEQAILEMQIEKMTMDAMSRQLTLEETKRLDLLIKNLHLVKGQATQITENKFYGNFSDSELMSIACQPEKPVSE
jgi:predicted ribosome quality control (RQC) complex YloA/Tae2 family protein